MENKTTISLLALLSGSTAFATLNIGLPNGSTTESWSDLNSTNYTVEDGYNTIGNFDAGWSTAIASDTGTATFDKLAGTNGYPASSSIYNFEDFAPPFSEPGVYFITEASPIAGLETVVFQTDTVFSDPFPQLPVLSYNGGSQELSADLTDTTVGGFNFAGDQSQNLSFQWDLSSVGESITDFVIQWQSPNHTANFQMQLDQGDTFVGVIPEPSHYVLLTSLCAGTLLMLRRKRC
ncbi:MAG: PEP-CTERM sorting domain-containing protein [Verrucomicrobiota bacterium]